MPIFDFGCTPCGKVEEHWVKKYDDPVKCKCGRMMEKLITAPHVFHPFREGFFEHIDTKPIYISSKKQLREECRKRDVTSHYLD